MRQACCRGPLAAAGGGGWVGGLQGPSHSSSDALPAPALQGTQSALHFLDKGLLQPEAG